MFVGGCIEVIDLIWPGHGWRYGRVWGGPLALLCWPVCLALLTHRHGEQRVARHEESNRAAKAKYTRWLLIYFLPVVAGFMIVVSLIDLGPSWSAAHGGGVTGTFIVHTRDCGNRSCQLRGDFIGDDGTLRVDVLMHDNPKAGAPVGATIPARDTGDRTGVFAASGSTDWYYELILLVLAGGYLIGWFLWLVWRLVRRRSRPSEVDLVRGAIDELDGS